jgi:hypothetical protein
MLHLSSCNIGKELAERHMAVARGLPHNQAEQTAGVECRKVGIRSAT